MELASLAQLERSHRRDDEVMAELLEAARRFAAGRPKAGDLARVHDAMAYLNGAVTRHFVDEDGSVFPRLSTRRPELAPRLAELSAEHPTQIAIHAEVAAAARELDDEARPSAGKALLDAATRLAEASAAHAAREDAIFGDAHTALTAEDDREIVAEMATRRGRDDDRDAAAPARRTPSPAPRPRRAQALTTRRPSLAARDSKRTAKPAKPAKKPTKAAKPIKAKATNAKPIKARRSAKPARGSKARKR